MAKSVVDDLTDGRIKLWAMHRTLQLRQQQHELFSHGAYTPLTADGDKKENLIGYLRAGQTEAVVVLLPRFAYTLMAGEPGLPLGKAWANSTVTISTLAGKQLRNVFTDEVLTLDAAGRLQLDVVFAVFPVAMLTTV